MLNLSLLGWLFVAWCLVTVALVLLLIYRSVVGMKEDDQLFLDPAESHFESEQKQVLSKLNWAGLNAKRPGIASGGLLVAMLGIAFFKALA